MRVIFVPVADRPECARALHTAFDIGSRLGASVIGCHMRPHQYSEVSLSTAFADAVWRRKSTRGAPVAAKKLYQRAAAEHGYQLIRRARAQPGALWSEKVGSPGVLMGIVGPVSDLIVVSRPANSASVADMFMKAALLESSRPVLVVPQASFPRIGKRVIIGWNQSPEAARAVTAALPILKAASDVSIVSCGAEDRPGPKASQLSAYLAHWGVKTQRIATPGKRIEAELLGAYKDCRADLLVAGAYSRDRWREKIFGGSTEYLLHKARIPILFLHS